MEDDINYIDDWPEIEIEEKFDWSLSFRELESKYGKNGIAPKRKSGVQSRWPVDTEPYFKISQAKKIKKIRQQLGWPEKPILKTREDWLNEWDNEQEPNFHEADNHFQEILYSHKLLCSDWKFLNSKQ